MRLFRCRICRTSSLSASSPDPCSFCGARQNHVVPAAEFRSTPVGELTSRSRDCLQRLLDAGSEDCAFYRAASKVADTPEGRALFWALARIVAEQVRVIAHLLESSDLPEEFHETGACSPSHTKNLEEAAHRARQTLEICSDGLAGAEEERVREILEAFAEARRDHLRFLKT